MAVALRVLFSFAIPFALAAVALLTVAPAIRAQASAPGDEVRYRAPDGSIKTISRAEHESRVADLKKLIDDLNNNRMVLITEMGNPIPVPYERLQDFAKWLEKKGGKTALEIPGWIDDQIRKSRDMIPSLTEELKGLTSPPPASVGGAMKVEWPVPMDWMKVKATMPLLQRTVCKSRTRTEILQEDVRLDFLGDGSVNLVFGVGTSSESVVSGAMIPHGSAGGQGRMAFPAQQVSGVFRWQITFNRENDELVISRDIVTFAADESGMSCEQTQLTPGQDPDADQFPEPMNWLGTKGAVHGDFVIRCSDGSQLEGTFSVTLDGNGNIQAAFEQESPADQTQASTWIQEREDGGYAELSAPGNFGRYVWNVSLQRKGNRIALTPNTDLRVVPNDRSIECFVPILANVE
jgi:hypothetical protein